MRGEQILVGSVYLAHVGGKVVPVIVDAVQRVCYDRRDGRRWRRRHYVVTNLHNNEQATFRSAARFLGVATVR